MIDKSTVSCSLSVTLAYVSSLRDIVLRSNESEDEA